MNATDWILWTLYLGALIFATVPLGRYMAVVLAGRRHRWSSIQRSVESFVARLCGFDPDEDMTWTRYGWSVLAFSAFSLMAVFGILIFQGQLPLNDRKFDGVRWDLALNTAVSFVTNTNWQAYSGETTLSALSQALALTVQNFVSAAAGIAVMMALIRGLVGRARVEGQTVTGVSSDVQVSVTPASQLGSFWIDLTRASLFVLLPLSFVLAIVLVSQGVVQTKPL